MPFIENKAVFGGRKAEMIKVGSNNSLSKRTFDVKPFYNDYQDLTDDNFIVVADSVCASEGQTYQAGNTLKATYDKGTGVVSVPMSMRSDNNWHFGVYYDLYLILMGGVAKLLSFFIPRKWGFAHGN